MSQHLARAIERECDMRPRFKSAARDHPEKEDGDARMGQLSTQEAGITPGDPDADIHIDEERKQRREDERERAGVA